MEFSLGVHHGNDLYHALKFAVGTKIFICSNGMVVGDFVVRRRHTSRFDIEEVVGGGLDRYLHEVPTVSNFVDGLRGRGLSESDSNSYLMEAGRQKLIPWSRVGMVDAEYRTPTFSEHSERTAWGLYNAFTYVAQKSPPHEQIGAMSGFREVLTALPAAA